MVRVRIEAKPDYVLRVAKITDPVGGLAEIIWNSLDAEARNVKVTIDRNDGEGIEAVSVEDDGHGMPYASCQSYFQGLGGSWKATARVSPNLKLSLHGRSGQGRLKGFALGSRVKWTTTAPSTDGKMEQTVVRGSSGTPTDFDIDGPIHLPSDTDSGTLFEAFFPGDSISRLDSMKGRETLLRIFAPYIASNVEVTISIDGKKLDPAKMWLDSAIYALNLDPVAGESPAERLSSAAGGRGRPILRIIEWPHLTERVLALCDARGIELDTTTVGIQKPGVNFSAYLLWDEFRQDLAKTMLADLADSDSGVIQAARDQIKRHLAERDNERRKEQVQKWKTSKVYPFASPATTATEAAERQIFDEVATVISRKLPQSKQAQKVSLRLLREALSGDPDRVADIADDLFRLPKAD